MSSSNDAFEAVEAREAARNDPLENVTDGASSGGSGAKVRNRKHHGRDRSSQKTEEDSSRRERREQQQQEVVGGGAVGGGGGGGKEELNNPLPQDAENNPPNNQGPEQQQDSNEDEDAAKNKDAKRDEEFVKEAIASVLFAQLDQIEVERLDRLSKKDSSSTSDNGAAGSKSGSPSKDKDAKKKKAVADEKKTPAPSSVLPAYFKQQSNIYWPPYKRTLANITSLPAVEVAMDKAVAIHDRLKGVVILGNLYKFNVWWVAYLTDCAKEGLRMFRMANQRLTPPIIHDVLVWMERKFWELIRWADQHISKGLEWIEDNYPIVTHTPSEIYADGKDKVEQALDWIQSFWIFNNSIFAYFRKRLGFGELKPAVEQQKKKDVPAVAAAAGQAAAEPAAAAEPPAVQA